MAAQLALVVLALAGPTLLSVLLRRARRWPAWVVGQGLLGALVAGCLWLAQPGLPPLRPPDAMTLVLASGLTAAFVGPLGRLLLALPGWLGLRGFEDGIAGHDSTPLPWLSGQVLTNGIAEEVLYRWVGLSLLIGLTGSLPLAAALVVLAGALAHWPVWGAGVAISVLVSGAILTLAYALTGDLWAVILAHVATDTVGLILPRIRRGA